MSTPPRRPLVERIIAYRRFWILAIAVFVFDQVTKFAIFFTLPEGTYYPFGAYVTLIPGWFYLCHIYNTGAAWGLFSGAGHWLALVAVIALLALFRFRRSLELKVPVFQITFGLIAGGIVGNLFDRIVHGGRVLDFLDVRFPVELPFLGDRWPAFNLADSAMVCGVGIYLVLSLIPRREG